MRALVAVAILVALSASAIAEPSAEQLYAEGQRAYDRGDYATAITRWRSSYELSKLPLLVFNLAHAYRLAGDCPSALAAYRQYVVLDPTSDQRQIAEGFVGELAPRCGQLVEPAEVPPVREAPRVVGVHRGSGLKVAGLATGGAGLALVATGLWLGHRASTLGDEVTRACAVSCNWAEQRGKDVAGRRDAAIGYALDTIGVAAIVGGTVMYYLGRRGSAVTVVPRPSDGGLGVSWGGAW